MNDCCTRNFTLARGLGQVVRQFDDASTDPAAISGSAPSGAKGPIPTSNFGSRVTIAALASVLGSLLLATSIAFVVSFFRNRRLRKQLSSLEELHAATQRMVAARGMQPLRLSTSMNIKDEIASQLSYDMMQQTPSTYYQPPTPSSVTPGYVYPTPSGRRPSWPRNVRHVGGTPELPDGGGISELPGDKEMQQ